MKDEYVSVEHIMMAVLEKPNTGMSRIFQQFGVTKDQFLSVLATVRGNTRVTSDTPEETYDSLSKYGQDLVELAKKPQAGSGNRPRLGDPERDPDPFEENQKQSGAHR